jgi:hypothetical protein
MTGRPFDDNVSWTQLGTAVTNSGATSLFHATAWQYEIGRGPVAVREHLRFSIRNGAGGNRVVDELVDQWSRQGGSYQPSYAGATSLVIVAGAHSGITLTQLASRAVAS